METVIFLQRLLKDTLGIPLSRIPFTKNALPDFLQSHTDYTTGKLLQYSITHWHRLLHALLQADTIHECVGIGGITFLLYADAPSHSVWILGPVLTAPFSREKMLQTLEHIRMTPQAKEGMLQFFSNLPVSDEHVLHRAGDLVLGYLTGKHQPMRIAQANVPPPEDDALIPPAFSSGEDIVQMRQVELRYEYSAALTDAIQQGNLSLALHMVGNYNPNTQTSVRNANPLRNAQNYCIVMNTQLRHALEKSGIHPYRVDKLSNEIGLEIEQLKSTKQLPNFFTHVIRRYCRLVQEHAYPNLKPLTNLAVTYIKEHLADNLTVKDTARVLTVNANYLSTLFHADMGMTFIDFVNRERTRQAAALLKHTNLQIQQVASAVGYNNTSYFAKQFMRFYGISPSHYRREGF